MADSTLVSNPLATPSTLPFSLPPFDEIRPEHYGPAFDRGMAEHLAEVEAIASSDDPPTFENTLVALERAGRLLSRASSAFFGTSSALATPDIQAIQEEYAPRLAAHEDAIRLDSRLYERIRVVHDDTDQMAALDPESRHLVERYLTEFTVAGAALDDAAKDRLRELNATLAGLTTRFERELLADANDLAVLVDDVAELDGLTHGEISAAAEAARQHGHDGSYLISLVLPTNHPHLASLTNRDLRRRLHEAQRARGSRGNEHDTRELVLEITRLRAERARLLGYPNHAAAALADSTAGSPDRVHERLAPMARAAAANARTEQAALEAEAGHSIEAHDWAFYSNRVRATRYHVDTAAMRPYFEAERVLRDGIFFAAEKLYGLTFHDRPDLPGYHPDVRVFEVREDGMPIGLYLLDLYARDTKKGGAWMSSLVHQSSLLDEPHAVVTNNLNVPKPAEGEPTLLTHDEVNTFFHEFGHALHGLLARVTYPHFSGTRVFRDFVEYPSQVNEMWMLWPEVLANYAVHHETGEPMPQDLVDRLIASRSWGEGFATSEYLAAALLDQAWHALDVEQAAAVTDVGAFEKRALERVGLANPLVPPRYSTPYFAHAFAYAYDAQYYAYIWSEVLDADTVAWFTEHGGLTRANGDRYRRYVIGIGGAVDPLESYREFRGQDADPRHLLERRGLA
ncbi:M3 family metallopeptidase [Intrasporangium sp.]|uniref:M3 family metallopeptidase n=1 Tax=Intrasporangium sp. TaxID=1925024 RepID=UPI00293A416F|nr:M3 family metallopeptidase [Intrasporangium sp.]MDV3223499.1 M3 family metallopeptidase [Intrasporangium sp.]